MDDSSIIVWRHYLRTPDGTVYGPVDLATLCLWAADARVIPGCQLSVDRTAWFPVESLPELRLNWSVQFDDATTYGPLNLLAIWTLASERSIPRGVTLVEHGSSRRAVLDDTLLPLLVEECRKVLASCGTFVSDSMSKLGSAHKSAIAGVAERDARLEEVQAKLEQAETDLAVNLKLVSETQRRLAETDSSLSRVVNLERETETLRASLVTARMELTERDSQLDAVRMKLGQTENELAVNVKLVSETQRRLAEYAALAALAGAGNQENEALCRSLAVARVDVADRESKLEVLKVKMEQLEAELAAERAAGAAAREALKTAEARGQAEASRGNAAEAAQSALTATVARQDGMLADLQAKLAAASEVVTARNTLEATLTEREARITQLESELAASRSEQESKLALSHSKMEAILSASNTELAANRAAIEDLNRQVADGAAARALLEKQAEGAAVRISELESRLETALQAIGSAEEQSRREAASMAQLKADIAALSQSLQSARADVQARDILLSKQESSLALLKAEAGAQAALWQSKMDLLQQSLAAEQEHARKEAETAAQLKSEVEEMTRRVRDVEAELQVKDVMIRKLESNLAVHKAEAEKQASQLRSRNTVLEKDMQLARQKSETLAIQLSQSKEALVKAQKAGRAAEQKVKDEMASIQRDLNGLMMASRCVKQVTGKQKAKPAMIDWTGQGAGEPEAQRQGEDVEERFARLTLNEKLVVLQKELHASAEEKELMRRDLENVRGRFEFLQGESSRKEKEASEKLAKIQKEIKTSSEMLARAMEELEKRESQLREMRKKAGMEPAGGPAVLDAEVVHAEVLGPEDGGVDEPGVVDPAPEPGPSKADPPSGHGVLNSVEAQLQRELKKWESLKRDEENKGGTLGKWFRRK